MKSKKQSTMPASQPLDHAAARERLRALVPAATEVVREAAKSDDPKIAADAKRTLKKHGIPMDVGTGKL
jgi:hypothetical protein